MKWQFISFAQTDLGLVRSGNEDSALTCANLIAVASREDLFLNITYEVDSQILAKSKDSPELSGMGTTLTALSILDNNVELLHIGDSRCYRYRNNKLEQLSYDHTVMQELLDQGRLTPEEIIDHRSVRCLRKR